MFTRVLRSSIYLLSVLVFGSAMLAGCAKAMVDQTTTGASIERPDMIIVQNFAVTPSEVMLDKGVMATALRDVNDRTPTDEENRVGHMVAEKLAQVLVEELRNDGIAAVRANNASKPSKSTVVLSGQFVTVDQGNQTARVWVGFGFGGSELRTRIQAVQDGAVVATASTSTKSGLKPGMLVSIGAGAAADSAASVAVGAATTGFSEMFLANVEADARRTGKEIAAKIKDAYIRRGWLVD